MVQRELFLCNKFQDDEKFCADVNEHLETFGVFGMFGAFRKHEASQLSLS